MLDCDCYFVVGSQQIILLAFLSKNEYYYIIAGIAPVVPKIHEPFCGCFSMVVEKDNSF
jgi:uncharacterized membrane protein (GlpM family)